MRALIFPSESELLAPVRAYPAGRLSAVATQLKLSKLIFSVPKKPDFSLPDVLTKGPSEPAAHQPVKTAASRRSKARGVSIFSEVVSGKFDAHELEPSQSQGKRVLEPQAETPKLHKVLAQAGLGSRLEMESLILQGRILVNREPAHVGQRIQYGDQIQVNGKPIRYRIDPPATRVLAYHKPVGEVVTRDDPQNRPTVFRKLPRLPSGKWQSVGRLDLNTEGLLLFTNSGDLANQLTHPRFGLEREYAVRVLGALSKEEKQRLLSGVQLDDAPAAFGSIEDGGGEGSNCWYRVTISEGRNREVRRMLESVGHAVSRLIRIRYGAMLLPRGLRRSAFLELGEGDIRALVKAAGKPAPQPKKGVSIAEGYGAPQSMRQKASPRESSGGRSEGGDRQTNQSSQETPIAASDRIGSDSLQLQRKELRKTGRVSTGSSPGSKAVRKR